MQFMEFVFTALMYCETLQKMFSHNFSVWTFLPSSVNVEFLQLSVREASSFFVLSACFTFLHFKIQKH